MVYLVFQGAVTEGIQYGLGLAIGCPLSCYLFLLIADPLLHQLSATRGVVGLSAFADDWTVCCDGLATLYRIRPLLQNFEAASGNASTSQSRVLFLPAHSLKLKHSVVAFSGAKFKYCPGLVFLVYGLALRAPSKTNIAARWTNSRKP